MKRVAVEIIRVYEIEVEDEAELHEMQTANITRLGELQSAEIGEITVLEENVE
jgi:hypothetical protein